MPIEPTLRHDSDAQQRTRANCPPLRALKMHSLGHTRDAVRHPPPPCHLRPTLNAAQTMATATATARVSPQYLISSHRRQILESQEQQQQQHNHGSHHPANECTRRPRNYYLASAHHHHHHSHHGPFDHHDHHHHHVVQLLALVALALLQRLVARRCLGARRARTLNVDSCEPQFGHELVVAAAATLRFLVSRVPDARPAAAAGGPSDKLLNGVSDRVEPRQLARANNGAKTPTHDDDDDKGQAEPAARRDFERDKQVEIAIIAIACRRQRRRATRLAHRGLPPSSDGNQQQQWRRLRAWLWLALAACCLPAIVGAQHEIHVLGQANATLASDLLNQTACIGAEPRVDQEEEAAAGELSVAANATSNGLQALLSRRNFGQRLLARGSNSLLARTLRALNGTSAAVNGSQAEAARENAVATTQLVQRDYETTQISNSGGGSKADGSQNSSARPNLSLDTWAKLINLRNMNVAGVSGSSGGGSVLRTATPPSLNWNPNATGQVTPGSLRRAAGVLSIAPPQAPAGGAQESFSIGIVIKPHGTGSGVVASNDSSSGNFEILTAAEPRRRLPVSPQQTTARPEVAPLDEQQELQMDSPGSVSAPTAAAVATRHAPTADNSSFGSPDWQASSDIEQVIHLGASGGEGSHQEGKESRKEGAESQLAQKDEQQQQQQHKGHEERGQWARERAGEERREGEASKAKKEADKRLVDLGHNKHGWKNIYHREEYAQHQKYHDIFRDRDWHDKRAREGQQRAWATGSKFNDSQARSHLDKHGAGSKYDYRKGNEWKRSEEDSDGSSLGVSNDDVDQHHETGEHGGAHAHSQASEPHQRRVHANQQQQQQHLMSGSTGRGSEAAADDEQTGADDTTGDNSDDAILEQMKARLEDMSSEHGGGGGERLVPAGRAQQQQQRVAAGSGQYELKSPPPPLQQQQQPIISRNQTAGWPTNSGAQESERRRSGADGENRHHHHHLLSQQQTRGGLEFALPQKGGADHDPAGEHDDEDTHEAHHAHGFGHHPKPRAHYLKEGVASPTTQAPQQQQARSEDKRNELRLKLELDLGKTSATSQGAANGGGGGVQTESEPSHRGAHYHEQPAQSNKRGNLSALTNSLGQSIGPGWHKSRDRWEMPLLKQERHQQQQQQQFDLDSASRTSAYNNNNKLTSANKQGAKHGFTQTNNNNNNNNKSRAGGNKWPPSAGVAPIKLGEFPNNSSKAGGQFGWPPAVPAPELHSFVPATMTMGEDLTVENSPLGAHLDDHELTLAGARPPLFDLGDSQLKDAQPPPPPPSHKEYMLTFGGGDSDDLADDQHVAAGSDHYQRQQEMRPPPPPPHEPSVVFEASASDLYDDFVRFNPAQAGADLYATGQERRPREFLASDFSVAQLNYASPLSAASEHGTLDASILDTEEGERFANYHQGDDFRTTKTKQTASELHQSAPPLPDPLGAQIQQAVQQLLNQQQQQQQSQQQSRPAVIASLRDHMHLLPMNLLRVASSLNQASSQLLLPPLASFGAQHAQQPLGSSASAPFGRWLRLPRVFESSLLQLQQQQQQQHQQQQQQLAEQMAAAATSLKQTTQQHLQQQNSLTDTPRGQPTIGPPQPQGWQPVISTNSDNNNNTPFGSEHYSSSINHADASSEAGYISHPAAFQRLYPGGPADYGKLLESASRMNFVDPMLADQTSIRAVHAPREQQVKNKSANKRGRKLAHGSRGYLLAGNSSASATRVSGHNSRSKTPIRSSKVPATTNYKAGHHQRAPPRQPPSPAQDLATAATMQQARRVLPSSPMITPLDMNHQRHRHEHGAQQRPSSSGPSGAAPGPAAHRHPLSNISSSSSSSSSGGDNSDYRTQSRAQKTSGGWQLPRGLPASLPPSDAFNKITQAVKFVPARPQEPLPAYFSKAGSSFKSGSDSSSGGSSSDHKGTSLLRAATRGAQNSDKQQQQPQPLAMALLLNHHQHNHRQQHQAIGNSNNKKTAASAISALGERLLDNLKISKLLPNGG